MKRILLGCYEVPGWGGSSTVFYHLFEKMQADGFDVAFINLITERDARGLTRVFPDGFGNPRDLKNVHTCVLDPPLWRAHAGLARLIQSLKPDVLFSFGCNATRLFELAAPGTPVIYMTAGSRRLGELIETHAIRDFMAFKKSVERGMAVPMSSDALERQAVVNADLIIVNSPLIKCALDHFFPGYSGKIYCNIISIADWVIPEAEHFAHLKKAPAERDIDAIFVASNWSRPEKNYPLVEKLVSRSNGLRIHIVGDVSRPCPTARHHGVIVRREDLYALLARSKTLVCPSLLDAAPAVLFEAAAMGCNIIASPNCGNWNLCNEELLADECSPGVFLSRIRQALTGAYKDHRDQFRGGYGDLIETLSVL